MRVIDYFWSKQNTSFVCMMVRRGVFEITECRIPIVTASTEAEIKRRWKFIKRANRKPTYMEELKAKIDAVHHYDKQKILDLAHGGKTIGEICTEMNLDTGVVGQIIVDNFDHLNILRTEAR